MAAASIAENAETRDTSVVTSQTRRTGASDLSPLPGLRRSDAQLFRSRVPRGPGRRQPDAQPIAHTAKTARQKERTQMMTRSTTAATTGRASAMRRLRRRSHKAQSASQLFCGTNGCASFLEADSRAGVARCSICGYTRRLH